LFIISTLISRLAAAARINNSNLVSMQRASLIVPRLYLSGYYAAIDEKQMSTLGVTHIISILDWTPDLLAFILPENRLHIALDDIPNADILARLDDTTQFIKAALEENTTNVVLIHCFMGISRSATVVCAYLISTKGMTAMEAINFAQSKRTIVSPNNGFRKQLHLYAARLKENQGKTVELTGLEAVVEDNGGSGSDTLSLSA